MGTQIQNQKLGHEKWGKDPREVAAEAWRMSMGYSEGVCVFVHHGEESGVSLVEDVVRESTQWGEGETKYGLIKSGLLEARLGVVRDEDRE